MLKPAFSNDIYIEKQTHEINVGNGIQGKSSVQFRGRIAQTIRNQSVRQFVNSQTKQAGHSSHYKNKKLNPVHMIEKRLNGTQLRMLPFRDKDVS